MPALGVEGGESSPVPLCRRGATTEVGRGATRWTAPLYGQDVGVDGQNADVPEMLFFQPRGSPALVSFLALVQ